MSEQLGTYSNLYAVNTVSNHYPLLPVIGTHPNGRPTPTVAEDDDFVASPCLSLIFYGHLRREGGMENKDSTRLNTEPLNGEKVDLQGHRRNNNEIEDPTYFVPISRVGCDAHMTCHIQKNINCLIVSFNASHNHDLVRTPMKHMLKINRRMSKAQKLHADDADKSGIPIKANVEFMGREVGGRENIGFLDKDY
ncbi:hypothetical protein Dsin_004637 [Dipteronia sinensis]|uniref:FAR1 domain-containing protein n=1 Tax=Dipteronia sinensis TaxID=43782 RepID=A0AAE0AVY0_9ROSI|nr:hypothetical protein Dsin_004637 [Dipteronia sinensis]